MKGTIPRQCSVSTTHTYIHTCTHTHTNTYLNITITHAFRSATNDTYQVVVVSVEPLAQLQPPFLHRMRPPAGHGEVAGQGAGGEVVKPVLSCV